MSVVPNKALHLTPGLALLGQRSLARYARSVPVSAGVRRRPQVSGTHPRR